MKRLAVCWCSAIVLVASSGEKVAAQLWNAGLPGEDIASISLQVGAASPITTLPDGAYFEDGLALGATGTLWAHRYLGFRGAVTRSETNGVHGEAFSAAGVMHPTVWFYDVAVLLRVPMVGNRLTWFPYVATGVGGKSYRWAIPNTRRGDTSLGGLTLAGGLEVRPGRTGWYGLQLEVKNHRSTYDFFEFRDDPQDINDLVFAVGITLTR